MNFQIIKHDIIFQVRMDIEESRKEERWEFEINDLFADTNHITVICKDILIICNILIELKNSFLPEMKEITSRPQYIKKAIDKVSNNKHKKTNS